MGTNVYLNQEYAQRNPTYHIEDSPWKALQINKMFQKQSLQPINVCEIGCGAGEILRQLQLLMPKYAMFEGYDISPQAIELCKQRENERLKCYCEDLLSKDTDLFDLLLCMDVVEHIEDYFGFLKVVRHKATYKLFHFPLEMTVQMVLFGFPIMEYRKSVGHLHYFMKETALATLTDCGYEIIDWFYTPVGLERPNGLTTSLLKFPRKILFYINKDFTARVLGGFSLLVLTK